MGIPLVDLQLQHRQVAAEIEAGFARVMAQGSFILGPDVERFEREFAAYCDVSHCIGVANGTDALELVLGIESEFGIKIDSDEMKREIFSSVNALAEFVQSRTAAHEADAPSS